MNPDQRSQVLDNARYLRQIRPIDPDEITDYVEGRPHPGAIRQVLREEAPELGLIERSDGRFEPVGSDPIAIEFDGVSELPEAISRRVEDLLVEQFGPGWPAGESGDRLRACIRDFKRRYFAGATVTYDDVTALGYANYHLPSYFAACQYVLADLANADLLDPHLRVLDVGAGVGGPALAIDDLLPDDALVEYLAVEPSDAVDVLEPLLAETGRNFHPSIHCGPIESFESEGEFDLILLANVLSELDEPETVLADLVDVLEESGSIVCLAPADRNTAIKLRAVERAVEAGTAASIYAPTVRLWPHQRPESNSWSFVRYPDLSVPSFQRRLDEAAASQEGSSPESADSTQSTDSAASDESGEMEHTPGEFINVDVQFAYSILRLDGQRAIEYRPDDRSVAKMSTTEKHVTDRVDYVGIKLSGDLSEEGGNPLYLVGDGSQIIDHFAVLTEPSELTRELETADYGDLLWLENVLVLWNDDEGAYNLVVDGQAFVERLQSR